MHPTTGRAGTLVVLATATVMGLGVSPADAQTSDRARAAASAVTTHESGVLIECTGELGTTPVRANLYQNRTFGNHLEVQLGDGGAGEVGVARRSERAFVRGERVRAVARLDRRRLTIAGTARLTGRSEKVHEVVDDAGYRIVSTGTHRLLAPALTLAYGGRSATLTCERAFRFRLKVTKTSTTG